MKKLTAWFRDNFPITILIGLVFLFYSPFILYGKLPIPSDTIVGMYHPFKDKVWDDYQTGVPFKNSLITDPVRQQYIWRKLAVDQLVNGSLPTWNPYSFSGTPLLSNFQTGAFYPLNIIFLMLPFYLAWGWLVVIQSLLCGIFIYLFLRNKHITKISSLIGSTSFVFSGFCIAWLEWNTLVHTILWLPLCLLAVDKAIYNINLGKISNLLKKINIILLFWLFIFIFSLVSSFLAGHLQVFFYSLLIVLGYTTIKIITLKNNKINTIFLFFICFLSFVIITSIQWLPTLKFINLSARAVDGGSYLKDGWFIPWQNMVQFIVPDFFGNPATGNYFGKWNYAEFIGYIGMIPIILAFYAMFFRFDKKVLFFGMLLFISLVFSLPTPLARLPYKLNFPFVSTSQPTRLIFVIDFAVCVLAALGFDQIRTEKNTRRLVYLLLLISLLFMLLWLIVINPSIFIITLSDINSMISKRNLILPTLLFITNGILLITYINSTRKNPQKIILIFLFIATTADLLRFGWKFTPFTPKEWLFPKTDLISQLENKESWRIMSLDRRIMPANFSAYFHLQDVSGYDPLYLLSYNKLAGAWDRSGPDISPAAFNRIVTPMNVDSFITDLLGVKYVLCFEQCQLPKLKFISSESRTYLYENKNVFPRVFLTEKAIIKSNEKEAIEEMYTQGQKLRNYAVIQDRIILPDVKLTLDENARIISYEENKVIIESKTNFERLLVLTDIFYPTWEVYIDGSKNRIIKTDFLLRGVVIPKGDHLIEFRNSLL